MPSNLEVNISLIRPLPYFSSCIIENSDHQSQISMDKMLGKNHLGSSNSLSKSGAH